MNTKLVLILGLSFAAFSTPAFAQGAATLDPAHTFDALDVNGDGVISREEFEKASTSSPAPGTGRGHRGMSEKDSNTGEGTPVDGQMRRRGGGGGAGGHHGGQPDPAAAFGKLDVDGNQSLGLKEFGAAPQFESATGPQVAEAFGKADLDGNGTVSLVEFQKISPPSGSPRGRRGGMGAAGGGTAGGMRGRGAGAPEAGGGDRESGNGVPGEGGEE